MDDVIARVSNEIVSALSKDAEHTLGDARTKAHNAHSLGLEDMSDGQGSFSLAVGRHKDLEGVIVKVVPQYDAFVPFARAVLAGELASPHFPEIYSITDVGEHRVILMEEVPEAYSESEFMNSEISSLYYWRAGDGVPEEFDGTEMGDAIAQLDWFCADRRVKPDFHDGNFRKREDGTVVFIDPVWTPRRSGDEIVA